MPDSIQSIEDNFLFTPRMTCMQELQEQIPAESKNKQGREQVYEMFGLDA